MLYIDLFTDEDEVNKKFPMQTVEIRDCNDLVAVSAELHRLLTEQHTGIKRIQISPETVGQNPMSLDYFLDLDSKDRQQRVFDEHGELDEKIKKLEAFLEAPPSIDVEDHGLLCAQLMAMQTYRGILAKRIERFNQ